MTYKILTEKRKIFVNSVSEDTLNNLLDDVLNEKVLNQEESEKVKKGNVTTIAKARDLIDFVVPKGPHASQLFIGYICKRDSILASKLGFSSDAPVRRSESASKESIDQLVLCPHEKFQELCQKKAGMIYPIREKRGRTRLSLIICNTKFDHLPKRNGSSHDIIGMKELLEDLGYSVHVEEDLTAREMESALEAFAARPEHKDSDSTFLVFMSHGILDRICGTLHNHEKPDVLHYDTIFQIFNNRNCCHLKDKPKVIIIQACRGANSGEVWVSDSPAAPADSSAQSPEDLKDDGVHKTHVEKDFVAFCSSTPHNVSWRRESGSLFITQLINCVKKYSWYCHLTEIFVMVQRSFEEPVVKAQMPTLERQTMTRYFYLFPGH
ncbi:caspase-1-like isoform X2 [Pteronotus mesoamericanus]|uniref:caspase-1-like isoform X2 n=1 Tax=Pteronotus mesoamericanus TaxID=1884717 RepID=UPI0023EB8C82|nr:caspase-1-like isoform X2 [Pteronotus parnellii mesoamericanus]